MNTLQMLGVLKELEKAKTVVRQNKTIDGRFENIAEHSWQLSLMALLFAPAFPQKLNMERVLAMLTVHDVGEIGVGDTSVFDEVGKAGANEREYASLQASLSDLDDESRVTMLNLWKEFTTGQSPEAKFCRALDALAPLLNHLWTAQEGENPSGLTQSQVLAKKAFIETDFPEIWEMVLAVLEASVARGLYGAE